MSLRHTLPLVAAALVALPAAGAGAVQTTTLTYQCKFPLIGKKQVDVKLWADAPDTWSKGTPTPPTPITAEIAMQNVESLSVIEGLTSLKGVATAVATAHAPDGIDVPATTRLTVPQTVLPAAPLPDPLVLSADGEVPTLTFEAPGPASVTLDHLALNMVALDADGAPIQLPPVTKDIDNPPSPTEPSTPDAAYPSAGDSDGNPDTFDIYCTLAPATQDTTFVAYDVTYLPPPPVTPAPTPTPTPTPSPTPTPRPAPTPVEPVGEHTTVLNYQCKLPLIGIRPARLTVDTQLPWAIAGPVIEEFPISAELSIGDLDPGLSQALETSWSAQLALDAGDYGPIGRGPATARIQTGSASFPPASGELVLSASDLLRSPNMVYRGVGTHTFLLDHLGVNVSALDPDGDPAVFPPITTDVDGNPVTDSDGDPNTFDVACKLAPSGQDDRLGSTYFHGPYTPTPTPTLPPVTPTPPATMPLAPFDFVLAGSTRLGTLTKGSMPLTGGVDGTLEVTTGAVAADLQLNDTQGRLTVLGFLPVTATVGFVPSGQTTGRLTDDRLETHSRVRIKVKSVKAFGAIPLAGGNTCQSKQLSDITLKSTDAFDPTVGGSLAGTYAISDLNGCGPLNGLVSPLTAGGGNTITVKLTPQP